MPTLTGDSIAKISKALLLSAGASESNAVTVADHLADANLVGHDSHGFIRIIQYLREIGEGALDPRATPEVVSERGGTAQVSGNGTFGQVAATFGVELAMDKAREHGIGLVTTCNHRHTGRIGAYTEMAARRGVAVIMTVGARHGNVRRVAPFGGREGRLGTNPISMGFPYRPESPIVLDFATSMAAEGKIRVYRARGDLLPGKWLLNREGKPSRDPNDLYDGGAILPMGGLDGGHKGYALAFMVDLLGGVMAELHCSGPPSSEPTRGSMIIAIDLGNLGDLKRIEQKAADLVDYVKDTPPMEGHDGVLYPGEIEARTRRQRQSEGVVIEEATWEQVVRLVEEHGLKDELGPLPSR